MLSKLSVKKPYTVVVAVVLSLILGVVSFSNMTMDLLPDFSLPYAIVFTTYTGANPEMVETVVTKPVEQSMATINNIKGITSTSDNNMSMVMLEFNETANMDSVTVDIRESLDMIAGYWPDEVSNPMIMKVDPNMMPIMVMAVGLKGADVVETSAWVESEFLSYIESIEGVASVTTVGALETTVQVVINSEMVASVNELVQEALGDEFGSAAAEIASAKKKINAGNSELDSSVTGLTSQKEELNNTLAALKVQQEEAKAGYLVALEAAYEGVLESPEILALQGAIELAETEEEQEFARTAYEVAIAAAKAQVEITVDTQYTPVLESLEEGIAQVEAGVSAVDSAAIQATIEIAVAKAGLSAALSELEAGEAELELAKENALNAADMGVMITADMISGILSAQNFNMPAGYVSSGKNELLVRVGDKFIDLEDVSNVPLFDFGVEGLDIIRLSDVATVEYVDNSSEVYASLNGESGVILSIQKQTGYSTGDVSTAINDRLVSLMATDEAVEVAVLMDQGDYIEIIVDSVMDNMVYGAVLAILILLLFLRSIRATFVIAVSIPISIISAIVMMYFSGITLNIISLSGLALGVGMLVDNSIVVIENIYRMNRFGRFTKEEASIKGAVQVSGAIAASTLTTVCVFLPIVFIEGITKQLFVDMGLTIAYSLLASLIVALTVVPALLSKVMKKQNRMDGKIILTAKRIYGTVLGFLLKIKVLVIIAAMGFLVASVYLAMGNGVLFMPEMDSTQITMTLVTEEGSTLEETSVEADAYLEALMEISDVKDVGAMVSSGNMMGMGSVTPNQVTIYAILNENRKLSSEKLEQAFVDAAEDINAEVRVSMSSMDMSALGGSGIVVKVKGKELDTLQAMADDIADIIKEVPGAVDVLTGMEDATEEIRVIVDKDAAAEHGLVVATVYTQIAGKLSETASSTTLSTDTADIPVQVIDGEQETYEKETIKNMVLTVNAEDGSSKEVKLSDIATFEDALSLQSISRENQVRTMTITANVESGYNIGFVGDDVKAALVKYEAPEGYDVETAGEDDTIMETLYELMKMLGLAVVFMYLIMVAQFQSLKSPFIIMFTVPLAFTGGFLGLWVSGMEISAIAMIGFVMLSGIIVNNGIVLVDYTNQLIESGVQKKEALIEAGQTRLRSIIMTALTTVLGLSTMALGIGTGSDMMQPMAVVTVGGLLYGTVLTLIVVPCIYDLFHRKEKVIAMEVDEESENKDAKVYSY